MDVPVSIMLIAIIIIVVVTGFYIYASHLVSPNGITSLPTSNVVGYKEIRTIGSKKVVDIWVSYRVVCRGMSAHVSKAQIGIVWGDGKQGVYQVSLTNGKGSTLTSYGTIKLQLSNTPYCTETDKGLDKMLLLEVKGSDSKAVWRGGYFEIITGVISKMQVEYITLTGTLENGNKFQSQIFIPKELFQTG